MDIIFKGRRTDVQERFRRHASAKLSRIERLDSKAIRVDVEVTAERNPRQADRRERVELTIRSRGPVIRAEAAADDRYAALDRAIAKLEARLRRSGDRRKSRHAAAERAGALQPVPSGLGPGSGAENGQAGPPDGVVVPPPAAPQRRRGRRSFRGFEGFGRRERNGRAQLPAQPGPATEADADPEQVPIQMEGDGPLVVREKFHTARPMSIDQALLEMELVGHDFYLFRDDACGHPSVVYRRHGYQYGLIRLIETAGADAARQHSARA